MKLLLAAIECHRFLSMHSSRFKSNMTKLRKEPGRRLKNRGITKGSIERSQRRKMHRVGGDVLQNELCLLVLNVKNDWKSRHQQSADARLRIVC